MRHLLLALPFALLPLAAQAGDAHHGHHHGHAHDHAQASLDAHEHGAAQLDAALDGQILELQLQSPAINLLGFEHAPASAAEHARVAATRAHLEQPQALFGLPDAAACQLDEQQLESPLLAAAAADKHKHKHEHEHEPHAAHSDIHARYRFTCANPEALRELDLSGLFKVFPGTEKIQAQLIGAQGQQGALLRPASPRVTF